MPKNNLTTSYQNMKQPTNSSLGGLSESAIQQLCFTYHWNAYPHQRRLLFMVYNTPKSAAHGAILKGMGMIAGVSDMCYLSPSGVYFLECKKPGGRQSDAQKEFQAAVEAAGHKYAIFTSLEEFKTILRHANAR